MSSDRREFLASMGCAATWAACHPKQQTSLPRGMASNTDFLLAPGLAYLQTGSLGPTPRPVFDQAVSIWKQLETDPCALGYSTLQQGMETVRAKAAALLGCKLDELVLTNSTTEGINWVAQGVTLVPGDRILTTDQEHPSGRVGWEFVARRYGATIDTVSIPPGENDAAAIVARFGKSVTERTRVFSFSHILTSTGLRMPVVELCALANRVKAISVVDGAQAVGGIAVDVKALGCDVYATSGHKWLLGPKGTGLLYLNHALGDRLKLISLEDGRAVYSHSSGVRSIPSVHGLGAAIDYINAIGVAQVEAHNLTLHRYAFDALSRIATIKIVSVPSGPLATPLLTYVLPANVNSAELVMRLLRVHRVEVKAVPSEWLNGHRVSTHLFNTEQEVDRLVAALKSEL